MNDLRSKLKSRGSENFGEEVVVTSNISFIIDSFSGNVKYLATHCYGCRVLQRVIEY